jgi:hypothetical protein
MKVNLVSFLEVIKLGCQEAENLKEGSLHEKFFVEGQKIF